MQPGRPPAKNGSRFFPDAPSGTPLQWLWLPQYPCPMDQWTRANGGIPPGAERPGPDGLVGALILFGSVPALIGFLAGLYWVLTHQAWAFWVLVFVVFVFWRRQDVAEAIRWFKQPRRAQPTPEARSPEPTDRREAFDLAPDEPLARRVTPSRPVSESAPEPPQRGRAILQARELRCGDRVRSGAGTPLAVAGVSESGPDRYRIQFDSGIAVSVSGDQEYTRYDG